MSMGTILALSPALVLALGALLIIVTDALFLTTGKKAGSLIKSMYAPKLEMQAHTYETSWTLERSGATALFFAIAFGLTLVLLAKGYFAGEGYRIASSIRIDKLALAGFLLVSAGGFFASLMAGGISTSSRRTGAGSCRFSCLRRWAPWCSLRPMTS